MKAGEAGRAGRAGATIVIGGVLALQLFGVSPWGRGGWYWPFLDYPMYSGVKPPGSTFGLFDLEGVGCDGTVRTLGHRDVKLPAFRFRNALEVAAGGRPDLRRDPAEVAERRAGLSRVIRDEVPGEWCAARVYGRIYTMAAHGLASADVPRQLLAEWRLDAEESR